MVYIEKDEWFTESFGRINTLSDVLTEPANNLTDLSIETRNKMRNTQGLSGDIVRILGHHENYSLIMKIDGAKGWIERDSLMEDAELKSFIRPISPQITPLEFLKKFEGVPYLWGGLSENGIDCSGLAQRYFFEVFDKIIPRNSRDQRKFSPEKPFSQVQDHNLVFGVSRKSGLHHVGIYLEGKIWNAGDKGVVCQTVEEFSELFEIEAINKLV